MSWINPQLIHLMKHFPASSKIIQQLNALIQQPNKNLGILIENKYW